MELGSVALDGTKVQASASKHKAMSYERMLEEEERLKEKIQEMLEEAEATDREEDERLQEPVGLRKLRGNRAQIRRRPRRRKACQSIARRPRRTEHRRDTT